MNQRSGIASMAFRYGGELVIVFVGVYAAFWVENWRDQRVGEERTRQVVETLRQDLADQVSVGELFTGTIESELADWEAAWQRGEKPPPYVFRIDRSETSPKSTWEAVSRSEIVELLDPGLVFDLGFFYAEYEGVGRKFMRYSAFVDAEVMPGLKRGNEWFYDTATGNLKPEFAANMDRLREFLKDTHEMTTWARCLSNRLAGRAGSTNSCRPAVDGTP